MCVRARVRTHALSGGWPRVHGSESPSEGAHVWADRFPLPLTHGELRSVLEPSLLMWVHLCVQDAAWRGG